MGCDIHMRAEYFSRDKWQPIGAIFPYDFWSPFREGQPYSPRPLTPQPYSGRNYTLFAVLADVRNGYGFAGVPTHKPLEPIAEPRGLPEDMADHDYTIEPFYSAEEEAAEIAEADDEDLPPPDRKAWIFGDHSFSWLTLTELLAYDYDQTLPETGVIPAQHFVAMEDSGQTVPDSWSGGVGGPNIVTITADHARRLPRETLLEGKPAPSDDPGTALALADAETEPIRYCVQTVWERPLRDALGPDWFAVLDRMKGWVPYSREEVPAITTDHVRIVFGFDS